MLKELFKEGRVLIAILVLIILFIFLMIIDGVFATSVEFSGIVMDKHYKSESTTQSTGVVTTGKGSGIVTTISTEPEQFLIMVKAASGEIQTATCRPELYYNKQVGQIIDCYWSKGLFTGIKWSVNGVR